jgi:hypothetical protein
MWRNILSIHLESKDLINTQQMEVAVNGPDGATHLVLCTGIVNLSACRQETFTFLVGPALSRRQFVGVIAAGALSTIQTYGKVSDESHPKTKLKTSLLAINANYDEETGRVKVSAEVTSGIAKLGLAISYNVSILAELPVL